MIYVLSGDIVTIEGVDVKIPYSYDEPLPRRQVIHLLKNNIKIRTLDRPRMGYDSMSGEIVNASLVG